MEPTEQKKSKIDPVIDDLELMRSGYKDTSEFVGSMQKVFEHDAEYSEPNFRQLDRILRLIALQDGRDARKAYRDMHIGASIAFEVLLETAGMGEDIRATLYGALSALESQAIKTADKDRTYPTFAVGEALNKILQNNLMFDAINGSEEAFIFHTMAEFNGDLASQYDARRGYSLVRMAIPWAQNRRKRLIQQMLNRNSTKIPESDPPISIGDTSYDAFTETTFQDMISDFEYDAHTLEGLDDCEQDIATLLKAHHTNIANIGRFGIDDSDTVKDVIDALQKLYFDKFMTLPNLKLRDYVTIVGNTEVAVYTENNEYVTTYIIDNSSTIRGNLAEPVISDIFSQSYIDKTIKQRKKSKTTKPRDLNILGATLLLDKTSILRADGSNVEISPEHCTYVSIEHRGVKVYRDPLARVME